LKRFYPQILKSSNENSKDAKVYCLCALGSRDRSISIWGTNNTRPLCVFQDLFDNPILDLSWSKQPKPGLLACSTDGTVAYLEFDYKEIGYPLTKLETEEFFMKKYNHDLKAVMDNNQKKMSILENSSINNNKKPAKKEEFNFIENFDALIAQEQKEQQQKNNQQTKSHSNPFNLSVINENSLMSNRINVLTEVN
jgi:protein HIRA/HIR1